MASLGFGNDELTYSERTAMSYAELHCKTNFSFLEGASHAHELVDQAITLGYSAIAVTDRNSIAGAVRAYTAIKEAVKGGHSLKLIVGAELHPTDGPPLVVWTTDRKAYGQLTRLITVGRRRAPKGDCHLTVDDIANHSTGLLAGVVGNSTTDEFVNSYRDIFSDRCFLLAELHHGSNDTETLRQVRRQSEATRIPVVAAGDVHYHVRGRMVLQNVLAAIRTKTTVDLSGDSLFANAERHLRSLETIRKIYADIPDAIERSVAIADQCSFCMSELRYEYPEELAPHGMSPNDYLQKLTWEGAAKRYPSGVPQKVASLLDYELALIRELQYEAYFLTVWDLVRFARSRSILCQGRGSAANSAVCYCLGVTAVDPDRTDVLFERFISKERDEAPDIDVDFEHERREEVLQYLYEKYGRERAGIAAEVVTYRARSAVRDVGKALGLSLDRVDALAKQVDGYSHDGKFRERCLAAGLDPESSVGKRLLYLVDEIVGFPRHLSQHVGGMVMTQGPLCEMVSIENAAMPNRTFISWDKHDLDSLGILKVDCLALGMLTAIRRCFEMIEKHYDRSLSLASIPEGDADVYAMICKADTMGVFQIESRAQMSMLPRLRPRCYYDLVIEVAIVRPGPIQGQMVHPYLRRRVGIEPVTYPNDAVKEVLHKTLGVPIFQEQAMRLAVVAAGFTPGEADQLRRAMGAWRKTGVIEQFKRKLLDGMHENGLTDDFAERVVKQIQGFGEYGFPESHAASFALLVYVSCWLKHYYPAVFCASIINSQPMGFYAPAQLVRDAQQHGVTVLPIDVNHSDWGCTLESDPSEPAENWTFAMRLGLRLIRGLARADVDAIEAARADGPFQSMDDFSNRTQLSQSSMMRLGEADVFGSLGHDRRQALWKTMGQERSTKPMPLFADLTDEPEPSVTLPPMASIEQTFADYDTTGLSLKAHPISFYRRSLDSLDITKAESLSELKTGAPVAVAGLVILRQRPQTAKGITFVTLEDETGSMNLVIHQRIWEKFYQIAKRSPAWIAHGELQMKYSVIHVIVNRMQDLAQSLKRVNLQSRDFR